MSQHDLDIANQGFPATRADINNALQALGSSNSGATAPSTTYANQLWYDTANNIIKIRNEDNDAWISLFTLDQTNDNIEALTVNGTITADALTVDTTTLHVDATNNRVGVGTLTPADHLAVVTSGANAQLSVDRSDGATGRTVLLHSSTGGQLQTTGSVPLIFGTADTERGRFLAGGGLTFNGDTAAANALDDYEEGTFTPTLEDPDSGNSVGSYFFREGHYVKVGFAVHIAITISPNSMGTLTNASDDVHITGLPFTSRGTGGQHAQAIVCHSFNSGTRDFTLARLQQNATEFELRNVSGADWDFVDGDEIVTGGQQIITGTYLTD